MANDSVHSEGIKLQAERVVRAYKTLRDAPKNSDFKSDDFPVGLFAELVTQIKAFDGWLQPADEPADNIAAIRELTSDEARDVAKRINRIAAVRDLTAEEARDGLHAETVRELRAEYPDADEREVRLRVAIRESIGMTRHEEEEVYDRISKALLG